jgi:two-component system sensor histidine kinase VicK
MDRNSRSIEKQDTHQLIAHDLRNIFASVLGLNELLQIKLEEHPDPELGEIATLIASQCQFGLEITTGLVEMSRYNTCSLNNLLNQRGRLYKYQADRKNISLALELPDKEIYIHTRQKLLIRVLDNLFDNAIKFTSRHGPGHIKIALKSDGNKAVISVSDTGMGIPGELYSRLFEKNTLAQRNGTENELSTGLGLYISKQLIEELDGELWFDSVENYGTTFYIGLDILSSGDKTAKN